MEEWVPIWDQSGIPTGDSEKKSVAHARGLPHPTVHLWCYTADGRLLFQQRDVSKPNFPELWDVSVAGHVRAGESIEEALVREAKEELGLDLEPGKAEFIGRFYEAHQHGPDYIDLEFHHSYCLLINQPVNSLQLEPGEVQQVRLIPLSRCAEEIWGLAAPHRYVPHDRDYYKTVFRTIRERLEDRQEFL